MRSVRATDGYSREMQASVLSAMSEQRRHDIVVAEDRASKWLGDANEAGERGQKAKEERCLAKAQYWLDRANKLRGWS